MSNYLQYARLCWMLWERQEGEREGGVEGSHRQSFRTLHKSRWIYTPGLGAGLAVPAYVVAVCRELRRYGMASSRWGGKGRLYADVRDCGVGFGERVATGRHGVGVRPAFYGEGTVETRLPFPSVTHEQWAAGSLSGQEGVLREKARRLGQDWGEPGIHAVGRGFVLEAPEAAGFEAKEGCGQAVAQKEDPAAARSVAGTGTGCG